MRQLKTLLGDSIIYGLGSFLIKATQVFVLPLIFVYLNKKQFGTLDYFLNIRNILVLIYGWGILTSIFKFSCIKCEKDKSPFNGFLVEITIITIGILIFQVGIFLFESFKTYYTLLFFVQVISIFGALMTIPLGVFRQKRMPINYIIINAIYTILFLVISYYLINHTRLNYKSILLAHIIASICAFFYGSIKVWKFVHFKFEFDLYKRMFNFGFSILLNSLMFIIILGGTRFFLKANGTFEEIGILGMALRLSLFVGALIISPFTLAWLPFVKTQIGKIDFYLTMNNVFRLFSWIGLLFCLILELFIYDGFHFINNKEYLPSVMYVLPFSISYFVQGLYFIFAAGIFISGNNLAYRIISIIGISFNLFLYLIFYNRINIGIVSLITLASFIVIMIFAYFKGNKILKINLFDPVNILIYIFYFSIILLVHFTPSLHLYSSLLFVIKIIAVIVILITHFFLEKKLLRKQHA